MVLDADKMTAAIQDLYTHLGNGVLVVTFTKKDGTERVMRCTRKLDLIPTDQHPTTPIQTAEQIAAAVPGTVKYRDPQLFSVFDLEANGWRSFRYAALKDARLA